jgi:hypothetical protein
LPTYFGIPIPPVQIDAEPEDSREALSVAFFQMMLTAYTCTDGAFINGLGEHRALVLPHITESLILSRD